MYTAYLCFGMFLGICGGITQYTVPEKQQCEDIIKSVSKESLGKGFAVCLPPGTIRPSK